MIAAARLARKMQQRRREERRERQGHVGIAPERRGNLGRPFRRRPLDMEPVTGRGRIEHIGDVTRLRHARRHDHLIRPHEDPMRSDLGPADARHADDFAPRLEAQKLHKRVLHVITPNDMDAGFHQRANGGCAGPGQLFPGELEGTLVAVSLRDKEVMPPALSLSFPLEAKLMRPCHGVDAILGDSHPARR